MRSELPYLLISLDKQYTGKLTGKQVNAVGAVSRGFARNKKSAPAAKH